MPVISRVGRRHPTVVVTIGMFYTLLALGGLAMVFPFLLMLSTSVTSAADEEEFRLIPRYFHDSRALLAKYLLAKHETAGNASDRLYADFPTLTVERFIEALEAVPGDCLYDPGYPARADDYREFLRELPEYLKAGGWDHFSVMNLLHRWYRRWLLDDVGDVPAIAAKYHEDIADLRHIYVIRERPDARDWVPAWDTRYRDYRRFKEQLCRDEPHLFYAVAGDSKYAKFIRGKLGTRRDLWAIQLLATDPVNMAVASWLPVKGLLDDFSRVSQGVFREATGASLDNRTPLQWLRGKLAEAGIQTDPPGGAATLSDLRLPPGYPLAGVDMFLRLAGVSSTSPSDKEDLGELVEHIREAADLAERKEKRQALLDEVVQVLVRVDPRLAGEKPQVLCESELWEEFVRTRWPVQLIGFHPASAAEADRRFAEYLRVVLEVRRESSSVPGTQPELLSPGFFDDTDGAEKLETLVSLYNRDGHVPPIAWNRWVDVRIPGWTDLFGRLRAHYEQFLIRRPGPRGETWGVVPAEWFVLDTVEGRWRNWVRAKHGGEGAGDGEVLARLNAAHGTRWTSIERLRPPVLAFEEGEVVRHAGRWRRQFAAFNYREVFDLILVHGNGLLNTFALIVGTIVLALTVNPLAAYALSRFNLRYSHRVLLLVLATMAFPAEVAMIPGFLLIRDLGMLNTFAALLLPTAANGYSIFLLKGFFDTLPRELYEAAQLDGASEWRMFRQITVPLCKPIFAFMALGAFTSAYGAFLFAMLTCQEPRMWTMMVWLYDLSNKVTGGLQVAAFTVAALPTLLVFVFCQRIIMRGIILPQMS